MQEESRAPLRTAKAETPEPGIDGATAVAATKKSLFCHRQRKAATQSAKIQLSASLTENLSFVLLLRQGAFPLTALQHSFLGPL